MSILNIECIEREKKIIHTIDAMVWTRENLLKFWERARKYPTLFGTNIQNDFNEFCSIFIYYNRIGEIEGNGLVWVIDDFTGVFYMTDIYCPDDAQVHFNFFDGRMNGREPLVREMLGYVFERYQFRRLSAAIPMYAVPRDYKEKKHKELDFGIFGFVRRCGFREEGRKRKCASFMGDYFDAIQYGILREEAVHGVGAANASSQDNGMQGAVAVDLHTEPNKETEPVGREIKTDAAGRTFSLATRE